MNKDSKWTWYYENGQIEKEENFKDGNRDGKLIYYNDDGNKQKEETYIDDELIETKEF